MIGKTDVSAREHMDLARHCSYAMTARYSHSRFYDLAAAVQALPIPAVGPTAPQVEILSATGTDGTGPKNLAPNLAPSLAYSGDFLRLAETEAGPAAGEKSPGNQANSAEFQGCDESPEKWRRRESNPRPVALRRQLLRV